MNRQENLIQILLKAEKPLTTQELAEQLNVSSRTIRSDLEKIESEILVHSMKLEKKPRVGIWIEGTQDEKDALFLDVKGEHDLVESYSKEYRRGCILVQILLSKNKIYPDMFPSSFQWTDFFHSVHLLVQQLHFEYFLHLH